MVREDEKMFHIGVTALLVILALGAALQVGFRVQNNARAHTRRAIELNQQKFADDRTRLSSMLRNESLRHIVFDVFPDFEQIGYRKKISISELEVAK